MPADPRVSERIYKDIKRRLLVGEFRLRERLDVGKLAKTHGVSVTPVRQALTQLTVERLVSQASHGFYVALWSERELAALYEWRGMLARMAVEASAPAAGPRRLAAKLAYPDVVLALLHDLESKANAEHKRAAEHADERLRAARVVERAVLSDAGQEVAQMLRAIESGERRKIRAALRAYHKRRVATASAIRARAAMQALPANGDDDAGR